jgi:hypothetical protein
LSSTIDKHSKKKNLHSQAQPSAQTYTNNKKTKVDDALNIRRINKCFDSGQILRHHDHENKESKKTETEDSAAHTLVAANSSLATCNRYNMLRKCTEKPALHKSSEKDHGIIKWGVKKKATSQHRYRGNSSDLQVNSHDAKKAYEQNQVKSSKWNHHALIREAPSGTKKGSILKVPKEMQCRWSCERLIHYRCSAKSTLEHLLSCKIGETQ